MVKSNKFEVGIMFIYLLKYTVNNPFHHEYNLNIHDLGWDYLESKLMDVYNRGGELIIEKATPVYTEDKYFDFKQLVGYEDSDRLSLVCDFRHGYLLKYYIERSREYPEGGYFYLVNKAVEFSTEMITFEPYDDEWPVKYVFQDFDLASIIFKEIYDNGMLSLDTLYKNFSKTG